MRAVKLCTNKILQFLTGRAGWPAQRVVGWLEVLWCRTVVMQSWWQTMCSILEFANISRATVPSVLWRYWLGGRKGIWPVKSWVVGCCCGICLERDADLHMAQLMPLPLIVSCFSKIQIGFTFLVPAHLGSPGQRTVKQMRVCVCSYRLQYVGYYHAQGHSACQLDAFHSRLQPLCTRGHTHTAPEHTDGICKFQYCTHTRTHTRAHTHDCRHIPIQTNIILINCNIKNSNTHIRLTALFPVLPRWAGTRKLKPIWILLKQETVSCSDISGTICKPAPRSRQTTTSAPHHSLFYRPDALPAAQPTVSKHWRQ